MSRSMRTLAWLVGSVALGAVVSTGCGPSRPKTVPVSGTVTLDAKPVEGASVMLVPEAAGRPAMGTTDGQGRFELRTFEDGDGALPGRHLVSVTKMETTGFQADADGLSGPIAPGGVQETWIVPQKYSDPKRSGLTAEVKRGMEPLELELSSQ